MEPARGGTGDGASSARSERSVWSAVTALLVGLAALIALATLFGDAIREALPRWGLVLAGCAFGLVPAFLWLFVFYLRDRARPEPKTLLLKVAVLAALLAAVGQPLVNDVFRVQEWSTGGGLALRLAGAILVVGTVQEFLKYAAVRHSVYLSAEYDEPIDGVVYAAAAGVGYAAALNLAYVVGNGGVDLGTGALRAAVNTLAHASFAGVTGYFLGRARFERRGPLWLPAGLLVAIVLNGVVTCALGVVTRSGLRTTPFRGVALAAAVAVVVFSVVMRLMSRPSPAGARPS